MSEDGKLNGGILADGEDMSVDSILADIYTPDGNYSNAFSELFAKYLGTQTDMRSITENVDLSDRAGEDIPRGRIEYEDPDAVNDKRTDDEIDEKLPESVRGAYHDFSYEAQRPGFTPDGDVKYPTMGVGESEERVVFDADWEEHAKQEAARLDRVKKERMLRGDSSYARTFITGGSAKARPVVNPAFIDPLSDDDENITFKSSGKNSYTLQKNKNDLSDIRPDWLRVEAQNSAKKKKNAVTSVINDDYTAPEGEFDEMYGVATDAERKRKVKNSPEGAIAENEELRSTIAQIVDKYNKREKEEEEKKAKLEEERLRIKKENEEREKELEEERKKLCSGVSRTVRKALESDNESEGYENFSNTVPEPETEPETAPEEPAVTAEPEPEKEEDPILEKMSTGDDFDEVFDESLPMPEPQENKHKKKKHRRH